MTTADWIPVLTAVIAVGGGGLAYWNQRRVDRKHSLIEKRRAVYEAFLHAYLRAGGKAERDLDRNEALNDLRMSLALVASDAVLRSYTEFNEYVLATDPNDNRENEKLLGLASKLVGAMRRDVFKGTDLADIELGRVLPIR